MYKIFVGDIHLTGRNPEARIGNIIDDQFEKIEEIVDIANHYNADIVQLGDIVHTDIIAKSLESEFGRIINQLKNNFYFIWGNHDLLHHSKELKDRTSLGVLYANNHKLKHMSENPWGWEPSLISRNRCKSMR